MFFTSLSLKNFGPFSDARFQFEPYAINWVAGKNASGKTQLAGAMLASIVGRPAITITEGAVGPTEVALNIEDENSREHLKLFVAEGVHGRVEVAKTSGPLSLEILAALSDPKGQRLVVGLDREQIEVPVSTKEVEEALPAALRRHPVWLHLRESGAFNGRTSSGGQRLIARLIMQVISRLHAHIKIPLVLDEWAALWPEDSHEFVHALLEEVAKKAQVIVLSPIGRHHNDGPVQLITSTDEVKSLAGFNYAYGERRPNLRRAAAQPVWVKGSKLNQQESRSCEYKEIKGVNPLGSIKSTVDQYAVAFMNAGLSQEGAIFWGIRDEDRAVIGVQLRPQECDELRRIVTERLHQIVPPIAPTAYRIELHPVSDGVKPIDDLYVVEVRIPSVRRMVLFATGGQEVYVKTDAGKRKLSVFELQQELLQRMGVDPGF